MKTNLLSAFICGQYWVQPSRSIPLHRLPQPNIERRPRPKPKLPLRPTHIQTPPGLPVRLGRIPNDPPREAVRHTAEGKKGYKGKKP
jgi:hypothetical protein